MEMPAMTDIVERLRMQEIADCDEAADEIERLRGLLAWHDSTVHEILADNTRLRAVLHQLVSEGKISPNARELLGWVTIEASP
jgi:hypothetical protein